ncbi:hypothetical protein SPS_51 [Sphingomonas phage Scott]|uniref:Uncharacterized protein n=1 Tax=Sphingomonas phage Scott TaxID=2282912 RepID=A0A346FDE8_9CAUD|nr:hypothetical protein HOT83_gp51 [Sphingomonas phage Scott]AXN53762.1 hypothetical protein SPS_51 [Sphingomonas phage Scott]
MAVSNRPANVPMPLRGAAESIALMKKRRDAGEFTSVGDALALQQAERNMNVLRREHLSLVEDVPGG